jgi:hypothetical protein
MSDCEDEQSPNPKFWLEFRTFDDGQSPCSAGDGPDADADATVLTTHSFPQFSKLPTELRLKIWACLVQPRTVVVCCLQRDAQLVQKREELRNRTHGAGVPALLQVNREARDVGLRHYELSFGWRISKLLSDTPVSRPPRVWFNFALDGLYLTGELEAYDSYGFNSPMVYFLRREDTARVRHVACAFAELGYPRQESDQVFGCLWHVADRFPLPARLLLAVTARDEEDMRGCLGVLLGPDNVMEKIWRGWMGGTTVTSSRMVDKHMVLVREQDLAKVVSIG